MTVSSPNKKPDPEFDAGVFLIDKPEGFTSFAMVRQVRRLLGIKKVGHAGTLDPFATGLLVICAGRPATRLIDRFMGGKKIYEATLQLGIATETLDPEGKVVDTRPVPEISEQQVRACLQEFVGESLQAPPSFSAAKHKGKPLYHYARKGVMIAKEPKKIEIFSIDLLSYDPDTGQIRFAARCGKGVYIRVLAADIAEKLGTCGHLVALRRLGSGIFSVADALPASRLTDENGRQELLDTMLSVEKVVKRLDPTRGQQSAHATGGHSLLC